MNDETRKKYQEEVQFTLINILINYEIKNIVKSMDNKLFNEMFPPKPLKQQTINLSYGFDIRNNYKHMLAYKGPEFDGHLEILNAVKSKINEYQEICEEIWNKYNT